MFLYCESFFFQAMAVHTLNEKIGKILAESERLGKVAVQELEMNI